MARIIRTDRELEVPHVEDETLERCMEILDGLARTEEDGGLAGRSHAGATSLGTWSLKLASLC